MRHSNRFRLLVLADSPLPFLKAKEFRKFRNDPRHRELRFEDLPVASLLLGGRVTDLERVCKSGPSAERELLELWVA